MNITFVTRGSLETFLERDVKKLRSPDIIALSDGLVGELNLIDEAGGGSNACIKLCKLAEELDCVVVAACDTSVCGLLHKSAVVIDCGKLLGVSDMAHVMDDSRYSPGGGFRVYDTSKGKIGIIVDEDLFFPEVARILTLCDSEVILSMFGTIRSAMPQVMLRAAAFSNGVTMCMAAKGYVQIADIAGEIVCALDATILEYNMEIAKDYHLICARRRGCYREIYSSFNM